MSRRGSAAARCAALLCLLIPGSLAFAEVEPYRGHRTVRVEIANASDVMKLLAVSEEILNESPAARPLDARIAPEHWDDFQQSGLPFTVLSDDLQPSIHAERNRIAQADRDADWFEEYKPLEDIEAYIDQLITEYPDLIRREVIGTSWEGRVIHALTVTGPAGAANRPALCFNGTLHAREWISPMTVMYIVEQLVTSYDTDPEVRSMMNAVTFYLIPVVNPDGYAYTWESPYRLWRRNRRDNEDGTFGVDLNRNWELGWGGTGSSGSTGSQFYRGPEPFSEPETQALRDFLRDHSDIVAHIDFHSYGQLVLRPYGHEYLDPPEPDTAELDGLSALMADAIFGTHGVTYIDQPAYDQYLAGGTCPDWAYGVADIYSWTIELRDTGVHGFLLPADQIIPTAEESVAAIHELADWAMSLTGTTIEFPRGRPEVLSAGVPYRLDVELHSVGETVVPGSPTLHVRFEAGDYQTVAMSDAGGNRYTGTLPPAACGDSPEYYISVEGTVSGTVSAPPEGAAMPFLAPVGYLVARFADDFEGDQGWSVETDAGLSDGAWERAVPVGCDRGDPPDDFDGSGHCYLTANGSLDDCNSDVDNGYTWLISPAIDLTDTDGRVQFGLWYTNNYSVNPDEDIFVVWVSNDDGDTWVQVETVGPVSESGWTDHRFRVGDFVTPSDAVRVRFEASDLGEGSIVEAAVDGFAVRIIECGGEYGEGDFDEDGDVDLLDAAGFQRCFGRPATGGCEAANLTGDEFVRLDDLAAFSLLLTGP